jgi:predicted PurR-regulated permease PerM
MKSYLVSKLISALVICLFFLRYIRHDHERWTMRGRDAFLAYEDQRFSRYIANSHLSWSYFIGISLIVILFLALYELIAWGIAKGLEVTQKSAPSS